MRIYLKSILTCLLSVVFLSTSSAYADNNTWYHGFWQTLGDNGVIFDESTNFMWLSPYATMTGIRCPVDLCRNNNILSYLPEDIKNETENYYSQFYGFTWATFSEVQYLLFNTLNFASGQAALYDNAALYFGGRASVSGDINSFVDEGFNYAIMGPLREGEILYDAYIIQGNVLMQSFKSVVVSPVNYWLRLDCNFTPEKCYQYGYKG